MIFAFDHIVFAASRSERDALATELERCGLRPEAFTLEFPSRPGAPRLTRVTLHGPEAGAWRERIAGWLALPVRDGVVRIGDVTLAFAGGEGPPVRASLQFEVDVPQPVSVPLAAGAIEITPTVET
jgi:hypothetical protein